jgi:parvulin-like peptidyl-prolyl isomerase
MALRKQFTQFIELNKVTNTVNFFLIFAVLLLFIGCASVGQKDRVLALVDGDPVTEGDLQYSLTIKHRKEDLSSAGSLNISRYVNKLIDDRLLVHEARTAGMDRLPEIKQALETYILRESVVRLHKEEIIDKVAVTEDDLREYYEKNRERFNPGIKLLSKENTPDIEFDRVKDGIRNALRKQKEKERSDEYLKALHAKAKITIRDELLLALKADKAKRETGNNPDEKQPLVEVNGEVLTAGEFISMMKQTRKNSEEDVINNWIERKLIDMEALSRHYERQPDLRDMAHRYENELLKITYIKRIIQPQVKVTDEAMIEYYASHQKDYMKPARYKIQQILVEKEEDAQEILANLKNGADFSWIAEKKSVDLTVSKGGEPVWVTKADLPKPVKDIIDTMNFGDISPIVKYVDNTFRIIKLQDIYQAQVEEYDKVRASVQQAFFNEQINSLLEKYLNQLKKDTEITIDNEEISSLEAGLQK